jgi:hypothetical protein
MYTRNHKTGGTVEILDLKGNRLAAIHPNDEDWECAEDLVAHLNDPHPKAKGYTSTRVKMPEGDPATPYTISDGQGSPIADVSSEEEGKALLGILNAPKSPALPHRSGQTGG